MAKPWLNLPQSKTELGIRASGQVVAPIVLGYPAAWPEAHGRKRPEMHWVPA